jgi:polyisoprenoid-binding protein YceI
MNISINGRHSLLALVLAPVLACSSGKPDDAFAGTVVATNASSAQTSASGAASKETALRLVVEQAGTSARYRVREQLVGHDLQNDAMGETKAVTGAIAFDSTGKVIREASRFSVDAGTFVSDKDRRDGFVRKRLLAADQYPAVVLVPTEVRGVSLPLPTSGGGPFELVGDLTVRGVTRPTIWKGTAQFSDGKVTGSAATQFTFADFQMEQPRVAVLLSVADTIKLEISFALVPQR